VSQNFATLAARGYYNGVIFHRVVPGFMVQGGDPTGTGKGGKSIFGQDFKDEFHPALEHRGAGILRCAVGRTTSKRRQPRTRRGKGASLAGPRCGAIALRGDCRAGLINVLLNVLLIPY
jgi:cyclophilin family peptidyl-prolyl cis-trans isomerase